MAIPPRDVPLPAPDNDGKVAIYDTVAKTLRRVWGVDAREMLAQGTGCLPDQIPAESAEPVAAPAESTAPAPEPAPDPFAGARITQLRQWCKQAGVTIPVAHDAETLKGLLRAANFTPPKE